MITEQEKQYIVEQRARGASFAQIGKALGRNKDAVRVTFNRIVAKKLEQGADAAASKDGGKRCRYCGKDISGISRSAKRSFCSDKCRNDWCNGQKRRIPYDCVCEYCGLPFISFGNPDKRFCSRKCYMDSRKGEVRDG